MHRRERVVVMGILNATPDSFYEGSRVHSPDEAVARALLMESQGADVIDVGGESSRPGSTPISAAAELDRVLPIVVGVRKRSDVLISIDTTKAVVAAAAIEAGATIVNDISALRFDVDMAKTIAAAGAFIVLMHMRGMPQTMQQEPAYRDVVSEVRTFLGERTAAAEAAGIASDRIILDPGIGFGKKLEHNLELLRRIDRIVEIGPPVLIGASRKSFLGEILDLPAGERLEGTIAVHAVAVAQGADWIRVHDVKEGRRTADVARRLRRHAH